MRVCRARISPCKQNGGVRTFWREVMGLVKQFSDKGVPSLARAFPPAAPHLSAYAHYNLSQNIGPKRT